MWPSIRRRRTRPKLNVRVDIVFGFPLPCPCRYRCPRCEGKGYRIIVQGKKVSVSAEGYAYHTLESRESCPMCGGLGACYPIAKRGRVPAVFLTTLAYLADTILRGLDWCAQQIGADGSSLRTWLEMDICVLAKRKPA